VHETDSGNLTGKVKDKRVKGTRQKGRMLSSMSADTQNLSTSWKRLLQQFRGTRVLVVGDVMLDRYLWGSVSRISPEAPVPVVCATAENEMPGGAANVARNIVSLGGAAEIVGVVGDDGEGRRLGVSLEAEGILARGLVTAQDRPTTSKTRVIAHHQQVVRFDREVTGALSSRIKRGIRRAVERGMEEADAIVISDYAKGVVWGGLVEMIVSAAGRKFVAVDPKVEHFKYYRGASVVTPNVLEASRASGVSITDETSLVRAARILMSRFGPKTVLLTRGEHGMSFVRPRGKVTHVKAEARQVFDVTGAGDTVIATFTLAFAAGASYEEAAVIANTAGGVVVGELGTSVIGADALARALAGRGGGAPTLPRARR